MLNFLLGVSITFNILFILSLVVFLRYKEYKLHKGEDDFLDRLFDMVEDEKVIS